MILKSIDLRGFKSFPEKTLIEFTDGITAIIGPNGSGKSNISDAVRWVLGEMSTKQLRGSKMEDVIFNGASGMAPAAFASVSLTLDTSSEYASAVVQNGEEQQKKAYSFGDAPEVTVTRKLYRTGESEYYINKKLVRLKDIYELFYDTGIGREGYSVIGQGKIAEVLSRRDEERRSIFEEAAGISKYRYKKTETERRLRDTQMNLVRVNDILTEIKTRIVPLEKEAENAKKYIELSEEKKGLEITLWLDRIDSVRAKLKANEAHTAAVKLQYDGVSARLAKSEESLDKTIIDTHELTKKYSDSESEAAKTAKLIADAESALSVAEADIRHLSAAKIQSSAGIKLSRSQLDSLEKDLAEATKKQEQARGELEAMKAEYDSLDAEYAKEKEIINTVQEKTAQAEKVSTALSDELNAIEIEKASLSAGMELRSSVQMQRGEKLARLEEEVKALQAVGEAAAKQADAAQNAVTEAEKTVAAAAVRVMAGAEKAAQCREKVQEQRIKLAATQQKRESLERMERLLEGYSDSVKTLLTAVREFRLRRTVYGTVSSLLSTTDEYVVAVETALGAGVQNIVVGDEEDAKACIAYLRDSRAGRATFLPVTTVTGRRADVSAIKGMKGFIGLASDVVTTDSMFTGIANELLGRTVIADDIDSAAFIARACKYRTRIVTLDGQVINAGGSYTGGSAIRKTGIMTRAYDIEQLSERIRVENEQLVALELEERKAENECTDAADASAQATEALAQKRIENAAAQSELIANAGKYNQVNTALEQAKRELEDGASQCEDARRNIALLEKRAQELKARHVASCALLDEIRSQAAAKDERERAIFGSLGESRLKLQNAQNVLDNHQLRAQMISQSISSLNERIRQDSESIERADGDIALLTQKGSDFKKQIEAHKAELADIRSRQEQINQALSSQQQNVDTIRSSIKALTAEKEEAFVEYTNAKARTDSQSSDLDSVSAKLWDEYELTYSDASGFRLPKELMDKAPSRLSSLKSKIRALGVINVNAVEEYRTTKERFDFLSKQVDDLEKTRRSLDTTIEKLDTTMKETFLECFARINTAFGEVFTELFGGGSAYVSLTDPMLPLESGIEIIVKPPGKTVRSISLLSGGEQSFAAIALYFALQKINPAPFCIFDEIESALDEVNVDRFADYLKTHSGMTQYILITHRRGTMECADTIYGVTMQRKGISEYLRLDMDNIKFDVR